jgi:CelD/BcsL family acetyltransferase involved in cellulose biosynthesis
MSASSRAVPLADLSDTEIAAWTALCRDQAAFRFPFYSHAFAAAVARARPGVFACVMTERGSPVAFLPLQFADRWHALLGAAEQVGGALSDYFGLVAAPGFSTTPRELLRASGIESLYFHHLPDEQSTLGLTGESPEIGHRIVIGPAPAAYREALRSANKALAAEIARRKRKLTAAKGPLRLELATDGAALDRLIERKRRQYRRTGADDRLAPDWTRRLLGELQRSTDPQCAGMLSVLYAGTTWVASHFGLRSGKLLHYWFPVYDEALASFGPGHLLLDALIDHAAELGIEVIDRGAGDQGHKTAYLTEPHVFRRGYWHTGSPRALVHRAGQSLGWRWQAVRDRLREAARIR